MATTYPAICESSLLNFDNDCVSLPSLMCLQVLAATKYYRYYSQDVIRVTEIKWQFWKSLIQWSNGLGNTELVFLHTANKNLLKCLFKHTSPNRNTLPPVSAPNLLHLCHHVWGNVIKLSTCTATSPWKAYQNFHAAVPVHAMICARVM
jgi:hypothetical protein